MKFKKPLTVAEQVNYLESNKRVTYNTISKEQAKEILYTHNYINVISPFKENFALRNDVGNIVRDKNGNHIYNRNTDFSEYYNCYLFERLKYPIIYENIIKFESIFNAIVSYETLNYYNIESYNSFLTFISSLKANLEILRKNKRYSESTTNHMLDEINSFDKLMTNYENIYIFLDRLSLSQIITVYRCVDKNLHNKIFKNLLSRNLTFGYSSAGTFDDVLKRIVPIRNCIAHSNSLNILINYYNIKDKSLRNATDKKKFKKIIAKLSGNEER